ncbi:MAG: hypothetical protein LQ346_001965 [Caloplaca aetnensis]|nr:MAG: hypothetical protein LQ346_001965 [Caloplaca aetnensis]
MAALTLIRYGVDVRIIDKRPTRIQFGHASGLQPRMQEILHTLNLHNALVAQGNRMSETAFWGPDASGRLSRCTVGPEVTSPTPFPHVLVADQGCTERAFDDEIQTRGHKVCRPMELVHYTHDSVSDPHWPVTAYVRNYNSGAIEVWHTKYLIGADGAESIVRHIAGLYRQPNGGEEVWAVADVFADTEFPDIRRRSAVWSTNGACMLIPNKDSGFRVYVQLQAKHVNLLDASIPGGFVKPSVVLPENTTLLFELLQTCLREVMAPFRMDITRVAWISRYRVSPGIADHFVDSSQRTYLVGDACHTESPKAGQSMNLGMMDSFNLTWKLALVLKGMAKVSLLDSYQAERRHIANQFIEFDIKFAHIWLQKEALGSPEFYMVWKQSHGFISGCAHRYPEGLLTRSSVRARINQSAREPLTPGKRLYTMTLTRHMDGTVVDLLEDMPSHGRFHLFIFAGRLMTFAVFKALANFLGSSESPLTYFSKNMDTSSGFFHPEAVKQGQASNCPRYIDLFLIHTANHLEIELSKLPKPFPQWGSRVYEDVGGVGHAAHGVSEKDGALALVRPDGYISVVTNLDNARGILDSLKDFMLETSSDFEFFDPGFQDSSSLGGSMV